MSILQNKYVWSSVTESGWASSAGRAVDFSGFGQQTSFYVDTGSASSGVVTITSGRSATGPWATIASTTIASTGATAMMVVTGPLLFVRPTVPSSGGSWVIEAVSFG